MADLKITELTENTTPASTDVTVMVDDPAGTPATQKVTLANLASLVLSYLKASGANVTTGTSDVTIVTPKAMGDAGVNTRLKSKIIAATFDLATATGDVAYTGVGFQPTAIVVFATVDGGANTVNMGVVDSAGTDGKVGRLANGNEYYASSLLDVETVSNNYHTAAFKQFDADGFTITWTRTNAPTGTVRLLFLCFR